MTTTSISKNKKIVLTGGGTAGHVYPALAVGEELKQSYEIHYIGSSGMEKNIVQKEQNITYHEIDAVKLERKLTLKNLLIPIKLFSSIKSAKKILKEVQPSVVFSKGGFVALPVVVAAKKLKIPVVSHESDLSMGLANKIILHYCDFMCCAFEETGKGNDKIIFTGQPIRKSVLNGNKYNLPFLPKIDKSKPNLLIVGGSSGAKFINEKTEDNLEDLLKFFNVIHITGKGKNNEKTGRINGYIQVEYADNMGDYLALSDYVLSRAGSGVINEFLALNKPMFLIPLSKSCSRGDQIENAKLFKNLGYCEMLEEEEYTKALFMDKINNLIKNDKIIRNNMQKSQIIDANKKIINIIKKIERD